MYRGGYRGMEGGSLFSVGLLSFELLRYFGPIPIIDQYIDQSMSIDDFPGRMHYDYVTDWIVKLLDEKVINNDYLCDMRPDEEFGRATRIAAKALKARTLLYAASPLWNGSFTYSNWKIRSKHRDMVMSW